ncbi:MAG TPA: branched-chain amino acid ABC transporter permease [Burkholderiales bacterium]|nr:branched-chain amino acid ABC transporter permease [Burkholderiales bacterium]
MNLEIATLLAQDALTNGAIYVLMALALVMVFAVTRVIFVPQGEFLAYGALSLSSLQAGRAPGIAWLLLGLGVLSFLFDAAAALRESRARGLFRSGLANLALPALLAICTVWLAPRHPPFGVQLVLTMLLVAPMGPMLYRVAYQPIADAPVLMLLIVSVAVQLTMSGLGLYFFGAEGSRTPPFGEGALTLGWLRIGAQSVWVYATTLVLVAALYAFFERTLYGKALRATASNRVGARLSGISTTLAGKLCFLLAALLGGISGLLIGPITTIYYDTGFLVGLKGFVGAIIGGLVSYPLAAAGALLVGMLESYASFYASAYKEVIVFTLIIPVLLWRSLALLTAEEE